MGHPARYSSGERWLCPEPLMRCRMAVPLCRDRLISNDGCITRRARSVPPCALAGERKNVARQSSDWLDRCMPSSAHRQSPPRDNRRRPDDLNQHQGAHVRPNAQAGGAEGRRRDDAVEYEGVCRGASGCHCAESSAHDHRRLVHRSKIRFCRQWRRRARSRPRARLDNSRVVFPVECATSSNLSPDSAGVSKRHPCDEVRDDLRHHPLSIYSCIVI